MTIRSFSTPDPRQPAFVGRPPVGEEGAGYAVVRRYLWPASTPDPKTSPASAGEGNHEVVEGARQAPTLAHGPAPSVTCGDTSPVRYRDGGGSAGPRP